MKKKIFALLLALTLILGCLTACGGKTVTDGNPEKETSQADSTTDAAVKAPYFSAFTSETIDGEKVDQDIFKGNKLTMVNVWGTFCGPCINEMPDLEKLSNDYKDKGLKLIGIAADLFDYIKNENSADKIKDAEDIIKNTGVTYMNIVPSPSLNIAKLDYISTFPTTYFLNENGEIVGEYIGSRSYSQWSSIIDRLLETV